MYSPTHIPLANQPVVNKKTTELFNECAKACSLPSHIEDYIQTTEDLDFKSETRMNVFSPWSPAIPLTENIRSYDQNFCSYLLIKASELGYKNLSYKNQLKLAEAILAKESYIAGFMCPLIARFHIMYTKFVDENCRNPVNAPYTI